ncbi:LPS export ABC transporter periplasmic protein LptC [Ollibium composti]|jgi:lipopolysaccharide export system protein LptC|uniref:LPS export ABC transporter periplasmic protein LptC n=1 Tax=Ollibium composti TaxID=2675109 RepID=A0ABY2Q1Y9_9HYPH|nr:LPS export ABC transporter periplasmic protein LptC [Mesorhizobium composti]THF54919.1 LPS export ABC transporter periplasmic protein LptC [Mesorhizobium composti]
MLARTTETGSESDPAAERQEPLAARAAAFGRAQRHSQRVRALKFVLPLTAGIIALAFPVYSYLVTPPAVEVKADDTAFSDGKLVMSNPKLSGQTSENLPYSMSAARAVQDVANESVIGLEGIDATLPVDAATSATVKAANGTYDRTANTLQLSKDILVTTSDGMVMKLQSVFLDMGKGTMKTGDPVDITREGSHIRSDTMSASNGGKTLVFEKRVRVDIDPAAAKTKEGSGEANAAQ